MSQKYKYYTKPIFISQLLYLLKLKGDISEATVNIQKYPS